MLTLKTKKQKNILPVDSVDNVYNADARRREGDYLMVTRIEFTDKLNSLVNDVRLTGALLEETLDKVIQNLKDKNQVLAKSIIKNDDEFDKREHDIEDQCLKLVLTQAPVAGDWREIAGILKMVSDIERIADHCADISKYTSYIADHPTVVLPEYFDEMVQTMRKMVHDSIECFEKSDTDLAKKIIETDNIVDNYFSRLRKDIEVMIEDNPKAAETYVNYILIGKYIERIADHTTNIAEWVVFIIKNELK